jgi:hypothetical protein
MSSPSHLVPPPNLFKKIGCSIKSAFQGPMMQKLSKKITSKEFISPLIYSIVLIFVFALVYALIGYKNIFETHDENKDKNIQNSIVGSMMLQSNAMGTVKPINSLGNWLSTVQVVLGWLYVLCLINIFVSDDNSC